MLSKSVYAMLTPVARFLSVLRRFLLAPGQWARKVRVDRPLASTGEHSLAAACCWCWGVCLLPSFGSLASSRRARVRAGATRMRARARGRACRTAEAGGHYM